VSRSESVVAIFDFISIIMGTNKDNRYKGPPAKNQPTRLPANWTVRYDSNTEKFIYIQTGTGQAQETFPTHAAPAPVPATSTSAPLTTAINSGPRRTTLARPQPESKAKAIPRSTRAKAIATREQPVSSSHNSLEAQDQSAAIIAPIGHVPEGFMDLARFVLLMRVDCGELRLTKEQVDALSDEEVLEIIQTAPANL
jgi:hypothetical protein